MSIRARWALAATLPAALGGAHARANDTAPANAPWQLSVTPYLWATALTGNAGVWRANADVDVNFSDILDNLSAALMLDLELRKGRFGLIWGTIYASLAWSATASACSARTTHRPN